MLLSEISNTEDFKTMCNNIAQKNSSYYLSSISGQTINTNIFKTKDVKNLGYQENQNTNIITSQSGSIIFSKYVMGITFILSSGKYKYSTWTASPWVIVVRNLPLRPNTKMIWDLGTYSETDKDITKSSLKFQSGNDEIKIEVFNSFDDRVKYYFNNQQCSIFDRQFGRIELGKYHDQEAHATADYYDSNTQKYLEFNDTANSGQLIYFLH